MANTSVYVDIIARDRASAAFAKVGDSADASTGKLGKFGSAAKKFGKAAALGAAFAGAAAGKMAVDAVKAASDLNETLSKSQAIFGKQAPAMEKWASGAARSAGLSKAAALDAASGFGDMFSQLGFGGNEAAKMSKGVVQLSADLGSFNNLETSDVSERMSAAFRGEYDSLQALIPNINAARVEQEALAKTGKTSASQLTAQEKAAATLAIVQKDGARASGDFARTSGGLANQQKILKAQLENVQASIGQKLLPVAVKLASFANDKLIPAIAATWKWLQEKLGPAFGAIGQGIGAAIGWIKSLAPAFGAAKDKVASFLGGMSGDSSGKMAQIRDVFRDGMTIIRGVFTYTVSVLKTLWNTFGATLVSFAIGAFKSLSSIIGGAFNVIRGVFKVFASLFKGDWSGVWNGIKLIVRGALGIIKGVLSAGWNVIKTLARLGWDAIRATIGKALGALIGKVTSWARSFGNKIWDGIKNVGGKLRTIGTWIWNNIYPGPLLKVTGKLLGAAKTLGGKIWEGIKNVGGKLATIGTWIWNRVYPGPLLRLGGKVLGAAKTIGGRVWEGIKNVGSKLSTIGSWAWSKLSGGLGRLKDRFATAGKNMTRGMVDGLRGVWDRVKDLTKKPLNGIITVAIRPFISAVNKVIPGKGPLSQISTFRSGGAVRGAGSGTSDSIPARLSNGEHVLTAKEVANAGGQGAIYRMRQLLARGRVARGSGPGDLGLATDRYGLGFAKGGALDPSAVARAKRFAKAQAGKPYIWGGVGPVGYDCSGFMSAITNVLLGRSPYSRVGTSASFPWSGFKSGPGQFTVGAFTGSPGHVAGTLDGMNVESTNGSVRVGAAARGATNSMFTRRAHLGAGGAGFLSNLWGKFSSAAGWIKDKIGDLVPKVKGGGLFTAGSMQTLAKFILDGLKKHVPGFATGGYVTKPTLAMVGENGPEIIAPIGGRRRGGGGAPIIVNLTVQGNVVSERDLTAAVIRGVDEARRSRGNKVSVLSVKG